MTVYTDANFPTKKAFKQAVERYNSFHGAKYINDIPASPVHCHQAGLGPDLTHFTGKVCIAGPHYPKPHTWYAEATLQDGIVVKVK